MAHIATHGEAGDDHDEEDQTLEDGGEVLHLAAHADASPLQQGEENDRGNGSQLDAHGAIQRGENMRHVLTDDDADGAGGATGGEPVAPADDETGIIAEGAAGKVVLAATFGDRGAEFSKLESADEGVKSATKPDAEEKPVIGEARGDVAGSAHDAGGDGIADGDGDAEADAEDLQELAAVLAGAKRRRGWVGRRGVSRQRQSEVSRSLGSTRHHTFAGQKSKLEMKVRRMLLDDNGRGGRGETGAKYGSCLKVTGRLGRGTGG